MIIIKPEKHFPALRLKRFPLPITHLRNGFVMPANRIGWVFVSTLLETALTLKISGQANP
jgi:hypothetical protein